MNTILSKSRLALRTAGRRMSFVVEKDFLAKREKESVEATKNTNTYRNISLFIAIPSILIMTYKCFALAEHEEPPEFKEWGHLRLRKKSFPWGDGNHSLFHNSHYNALPEGYEEDSH